MNKISKLAFCWVCLGLVCLWTCDEALARGRGGGGGGRGGGGRGGGGRSSMSHGGGDDPL